jgi:hypothetical protein
MIGTTRARLPLVPLSITPPRLGVVWRQTFHVQVVRRARSHLEPRTAQIREADPLVLGQEPLRDHLLPRVDHGRILQPGAAEAGRCTTKLPPFPGLRMNADDPARLRATNTPGNQPPELLPLRRQRRPTEPTLNHRNPPSPQVLR